MPDQTSYLEQKNTRCQTRPQPGLSKHARFNYCRPLSRITFQASNSSPDKPVQASLTPRFFTAIFSPQVWNIPSGIALLLIPHRCRDFHVRARDSPRVFALSDIFHFLCSSLAVLFGSLHSRDRKFAAPAYFCFVHLQHLQRPATLFLCAR